MQRLVIALIFVAIAVALVAFVFRQVTRASDRVLRSELVATGSTMQKVSFFLLLCLMIYVSMSGAS